MPEDQTDPAFQLGQRNSDILDLERGPEGQHQPDAYERETEEGFTRSLVLAGSLD